MNENIDLTKILKDCPKGTKLYSPLFGEVNFEEIRNDYDHAIAITIGDLRASFTQKGFYYAVEDGECLLFPSKDQRDWSKFTAPWYKKKKFNKQKNNVHFYVARDSDGSLWLYIGMPHRNYSSFNTNIRNTCIELNDKNILKYFGLNKDDYTNLKWEDEPIEVFVNMENN